MRTNKTALIWSAPRLQRVNFRDVQDWVSCKHISGLSLGALVSRALMGSAHTRLIKLTVSKTKAQYRLLACRSDLSCHHFYFTPRNRWRLLPPKKTLRIPPGQSWPEACLRSWQTCSPTRLRMLSHAFGCSRVTRQGRSVAKEPHSGLTRRRPRRSRRSRHISIDLLQAAFPRWLLSKVIALASIAQAARAFLFASATVAMFLPRRDSTSSAQRRRRLSCRPAARSAARAP